MRLIIAGGRRQQLSEAHLERLDRIHAEHGVSEVISGGAKGVDRDGELWAQSRRIPVRRFEADWRRYRSGAGPRRNKEMASYADAVVLFPGGAGTSNMREQAQKAGLTIFDFMSE